MNNLNQNLEDEFPGYASYPESDDLFVRGKKDSALDPENLENKKAPNLMPGDWNEKDFNNLETGEDLDIPGAELDDLQEDIGAEDEENNYYSIGGDNHDSLEESRD